MASSKYKNHECLADVRFKCGNQETREGITKAVPKMVHLFVFLLLSIIVVDGRILSCKKRDC